MNSQQNPGEVVRCSTVARPGRRKWLASQVTLATNLAPFTEADLNEARQSLARLGDLYVHRLAAADPAEWDRPRDPQWTVRTIAEHVADPWYARQVGNLGS